MLDLKLKRLLDWKYTPNKNTGTLHGWRWTFVIEIEGKTTRGCAKFFWLENLATGKTHTKIIRRRIVGDDIYLMENKSIAELYITKLTPGYD